MKIHKIDLSGKTTKAELTTGSKILRSGIQMRDGKPVTVVWYLSPSLVGTISVRFVNVPTGSDAPAGFRYIGTTQYTGNGSEEVRHQFVDGNAAVSIER